MKQLVALLFLTACAPAYAQTCAPMSEVAKILTDEHGETPIGQGITKQGDGLTIWAGPEGSWTITMHPVAMPGLACLSAVGEAWQAAVKPKGQGS